ncbi:hypothetical protein DPMN_011692 [Dreissena polymorpha]|uniref:MAM domain-containing protein n=1 Tax=Dreissena polymorpha TaxID=45954 RepID=A0A9D4N5L2_DREPO|nr:hypothetical protein DPMN_011692 [Dreissena polymorpha]
MFIESSAPRSPGDNAILQSATFSGSSSPLCLQFYYNMYGSSIGSLRVWALPQGGNSVKVWELSGNQGLQWSQATVNVGQATQFQVCCTIDV